MKIKYSEQIDTRTLEGLKKAESLQAAGWEIASVGFYTIQFFKR